VEEFTTTPFSTTPAGLSNIIDRMSRGIEPYQIVREIVWNGIQAIQRDAPHAEDGPQPEVRISKSKHDPNKLIIANIGGEALTHEIAVKHLATIGCSGHGTKNNFGVGAKISYLPRNKEGLTYLCRTVDMEFTIGKGRLNYYGFLPYGDDPANPIEVVKPEDWTHEDSETEVILNGSTPEEDTWAAICSACSPSDTTVPNSGHQIANHLKKKIWDSNQIPDIRVAIYNEGGEFVKNTKVMGCLGVKNSYENKEAEGCVAGQIEHPDGTIIHYYARKFKAGKKVGTQHPAGFVATVHENELYMQPTSSEYGRKTLMRSFGIQTHDKHAAIIIEPLEGKYVPTIQRTGLVDDDNNGALDIPSYAKYFRENMPDNLRRWMANLSTPIVSNVEAEARQLFSIGQTKPAKSNSKQKVSGPPRASGRVRKRKPARGSGGPRRFDPPAFNFFKDDQEESTSTLDPFSWKIGINKAGELFKSKVNQLLEDYRNQKDPNITLGVVEQALSEEIYLQIARCYVSWRNQRPTATRDSISRGMQEGSGLENVWIGKESREYYKRIDKIFDKKKNAKYLEVED